jgi:hypothetical protein
MFKAGVVLLLLVTLYALMFYKSLRQVDAFCSRVSTNTDVSALPQIANDLGVKLVGPLVRDAGASRVFATVVSPMTMGDYGCDVQASSLSGKVERKTLGYR